jgi:hypothetical protein
MPNIILYYIIKYSKIKYPAQSYHSAQTLRARI